MIDNGWKDGKDQSLVCIPKWLFVWLFSIAKEHNKGNPYNDSENFDVARMYAGSLDEQKREGE